MGIGGSSAEISSLSWESNVHMGIVIRTLNSDKDYSS
jgi:hypothetical protein